MLREHGVVGKFVEFYGPGVPNLPLADRATIGNMSPEFGSTCAMFPIDAETLRYLEFSGRDKDHIALVEAYARAQGLWHDEHSEEPTYSETLELDLGEVVPSLAGPKRPQDRVALTESKASFRMALDGFLPESDACDEAVEESFPASDPPAPGEHETVRDEEGSGTGGVQVADRASVQAQVTLADGTETELDHGHVVIAAITSCTNTSNPSVMLGAGLLAKNARRARPAGQAVGEDVARPGLEGRHRVLRARRPDQVPRAARLPPRRLRLHDLHRQLRSAAGGDLRRRQRRGPRGRVGALGQPQLRGPHQPRREDELPRVAAAVRRLRARGDDGHRPARRAARAGLRRRGRLPQGHLAERRGRRAHGRGGRPVGHVHELLRRGVRRRRALELAGGAGGRPLRVGRRLDLRAQAAVLRGPAARAGAGRRHRGRARARRARRLGDDRPHLAGGRDQEGLAGRPVPQRARGRQQGLQLVRLTARQPRGDDARHVRQHPPAQLHRAAGSWSAARRSTTARSCRSTTPR